MARTMKEIEELTGEFADARAALAYELNRVEDEFAAIKRRALPKIKRLVSRAASAHEALSLAIDDSRENFEKPRSRILRGIRVGLQKQPGQVKFENADIVVRLIRKHLPEQADALIRVSETPVKKTLSLLSGAELKKIGVAITDTTDAVLIKPADSEIDKLVDALLADDAETAGAVR